MKIRSHFPLRLLYDQVIEGMLNIFFNLYTSETCVWTQGKHSQPISAGAALSTQPPFNPSGKQSVWGEIEKQQEPASRFTF